MSGGRRQRVRREISAHGFAVDTVSGNRGQGMAQGKGFERTGFERTGLEETPKVSARCRSGFGGHFGFRCELGRDVT